MAIISRLQLAPATRLRSVFTKSPGTTTGPDASVAIVDDEAFVRKAFARLLAACAVKSRTYASAREFLGVVGWEVPQCLIVDLQMPEMTGLELLGELLRAGVKIPTIVVTAQHGDALHEQCRVAGAAAYLVKPVDGTKLIPAINNAIEQRRGLIGISAR
jgi:FixJ family two-component response regulator